MQPVAEPNQVGHLFAVFLVFAQILALVKQGHLDVLEDGELRDEVVGLEDETDPASTHLRQLVIGHPGNIFIAQEIGAGSRSVQATEQVQHGRLAGSRRTHDGQVRTAGDLQINSG